MKILSVSRGVSLGLLVSLLITVNICYADDKTVEVVGLGECADCKESNIKTSQAFSGLRVTVECKSNKGEFQTRGVGELDNEGKFKVDLPKEFLKDGKLNEECYAQLHSASSAPCPAHNGIESSKIIFQSKSTEKHTFGPTGTLKFSTAFCPSAFLWPYKHSWKKYPPLPPLSPHPWKKYLPPYKHYSFPPLPKYKKPCPPIPVYTKPPVYYSPTPVPIYKPKPKPYYSPTPVPVYKPKPKPPVYYSPTPVPVYKPKPKPPVYYSPTPVPVYKPKPEPPVYVKPLPPPVPIYTKPFPPPVPIYKKPCPPIIPLPTLPPKPFYHPKMKYFPPLPPYFPPHP